MHADHVDPMVEDLQAPPKRIGEPILAAWNVKEDLMDQLSRHGTQPDRVKIRDRRHHHHHQCRRRRNQRADQD